MKTSRCLPALLAFSMTLTLTTAASVEEAVQSARLSPTSETIRELVGALFKACTEKQGNNEGTAGSRQKRSYYYRRRHWPSVDCETTANQSVVYDLQADPDVYPNLAIAEELFERALPSSDMLFQELLRVIVDPTGPPVVEPQPELDDPGSSSCPQATETLISYNSVMHNSTCFPLLGFQENVLYNDNCEGECRNCLRRWYSYKARKLFQNSCLPHFRTVSIWSYCRELTLGQRIVRDRILVPADCSCAVVVCEVTWRHWRG